MRASPPRDVPSPMLLSRLLPAALLALLLPLVVVSAPSRGLADESDLERRKEALLLHLKVHRAIDTGAVWVASRQRPDGSFALGDAAAGGAPERTQHRFGESALATYTLAHCGYTTERKEIQRAVAYLRKHYRSLMGGDHLSQASSYALSLTVLALHTLYAKEAPDDSDADRRRYGNARGARKNPCDYPSWAAAMIERILDWLVENQAERGLFRYPGYPGGLPGAPAGFGFPGRGGGEALSGPEDMSNTQYVLLALWAGARCGYEVDPKALHRMATRLLEWQQAQGPRRVRERDPRPPPQGPNARYGNAEAPEMTDYARGFGYTPGEPPSGSMTTAGLSSLAVVKAMLEETGTLDPTLGRRLDQAMWDAIAWLSWRYSITQNPPSLGPRWHYYYLYGLERACVIVGKKTLGRHDWYTEGARLLVDAQEGDGRWAPLAFGGGPRRPGGLGNVRAPAASSGMDLLDSCFALLFLERAALEPKAPVLPGPAITPSETDLPRDE